MFFYMTIFLEFCPGFFFQESLLKQVRITHGVYCLLNLISLVAFIALVETHLFSDTHKLTYFVIMEATNRWIIYLIPISLLIMNAALCGAYTHHVKTLRDAVRTWDAITPSIPASSISRRHGVAFFFFQKAFRQL